MVGPRSQILGLVLVSLVAGPAQAATFTVTNTNDAGAGSLRDAITSANGALGLDTIDFNILPSGAQTITLASALPAILDAVVINGTTQPGWTNAPPYAPVVALNANGFVGLQLQNGSSGSTIRGLCIRNAGAFPGGISITSSSNNVVAGNFIGTDLAGTAPGPGNQIGVFIGGGTTNNNRIGVNPAAVDARDRNVISGNTLDGIEIRGEGAGATATGNVIAGNFIGTDVTGAFDLGNANQGIAVFYLGGAGANVGTVIGGTVAGTGNLISGNNGYGILIASAGTTGTLVQGNRIGTNAAGSAGIPNTVGIRLDTGSVSGNTVGGTLAAAANLVAYNTDDGVRLEANAGTGNAILGNAIYANGSVGIDLNNDVVTANDALDADGGPNGRQNFPVLSGASTNLTDHVHVAGALKSAASTTYRVEFFATSALVGPDPSGFGEGQRFLGAASVATDGNGNASIGVSLAAVVAAGEYVTATATDPANNTSEFSAAILAYASLIVTTTADTVDGDTASVSALITNPGNPGDGRISLREAITAANNTGGLDTIRFGIPLTDAGHVYYADNGIGGGSLAAPTATTLADLATPSSPTIANYDADYPAGTARSWYLITLGSALPPITSPVALDTTSQPLSLAGAGPVIEVDGAAGGTFTLDLQAGSSGSAIRGLIVNRAPGEGIRIRTSNNVVAGNFLGTNPAGTGAGPGNWTGVRVTGALGAADNNRIGGTVAADRNVISGNSVDGIQISGGAGGAASTLVQGNSIGTDVTGTKYVGNAKIGIAVFTNATSTVIGGNTITLPGAGNVISGNVECGISINDLGTTGTLVQGNKIGTNDAGTAAVSNSSCGVRIIASASNNTIGGGTAGTGNLIANNNPGNAVGLAGVLLSADAGAGNAVLGNSIHSNGALGIDLAGDGVTANDGGDVDLGPNDLLNFPQITSALHYGGTVTVRCRLDVPAGSYRIEYFKNPSGADASGYGEGEVFADSRTVTLPVPGAIYFNRSFAGNAGDVVTATATACTDGPACTAFGSTSEFSNAVAAVTTAVGLMSFTAAARDGGVDLSWATGSEIDNLGFHVYRSLSADGPWTRLTPSLIPGQGFSATGASYTWPDSRLENGTRYFYRLEDVDSRAISTFHGPVSAMPQAAANPAPPEPGGPGSGSGSSSCPAWALSQLGSSALYTCETHGEPTSSFRVLSRTSRSVLVELQTGGFLTARDGTGRVRALLPAFDSLSDPLAPALPLKRARLDGLVGRQARIGSVQARESRFFPGLRAAAVGYPQAVVAPDGTVQAGRREAELGLSRGVFPRVQARLAGEGFQGEDKSLALELLPLRYDASRGALVLSRKLTVRIDFAGALPSETGRGRLGRHVPRPRPDSSAYAFLGTSQKGLHSVAFEAVFPGRSRAVDLASLRLTRGGGVSVPFFVLPRGPSFGPGSRLFFHVDATASSISFSPEVVYALERRAEGLSMSLVSASPDDSPAITSRGRASFETNRVFAPDVLDIEDLWQWESIGSGVSKAKPFALDGLDASSSETARLVVYLQGGSDAVSVVDHHVQVFVNGALVAEETFDGALPHRLEADVPVSLLAAANELTVTSVGDTGVSSRVFLDRFEILYPQVTAARSGVFDGVFSSAGTAEVEGLDSPAAVVDVTSGASWLTGFEAGPSLRFRAEAGHRYLAVSQEGLLAPRVFFPEPSARLRSTQNQADYVLVAPKAFMGAAQPLLERREAQGLTTVAASLEEIASSFGGGQPSAEAIREFLSFAYHQWRRPSPRYVLLLGDSNHDPRRFNPASQPSPMPFLLQRTSYIWTASDPALAAVNGEDALPDLAIGRLPATTLEQAETMVGKILDWEAQGQNLDGNAALVADNPDLAGDFEADARNIEASFLTGRETTEIFLGQLPNRDVARAQILDAFNSGLSLISYVGHGGGAVWASENMLNSSDPASLLAQPRQPFMLTMNCLNGYFITPFYESLAEGFLKAEGRGTIGSFSPSGLSLDGPAHLYHRAVMQELTGGQHQRLGDAILAAQKTYAQSGAFPELLAIYHLFGDPALKVR